MLTLVTDDGVTGCQDDLGALQAVAGEPELSPEDAEASTEGQTGNTDARARTPRHGDVVRSEGGVQVDEPGPRSDRDQAVGGVDAHLVHGRDVDDETVAGRPAPVAVTPRAHRQLQIVPLGKGDGRGDVGSRGTVGDAGGMRVVEDRVVGLGVDGVARARRAHEPSLKRAPEGFPLGLVRRDLRASWSRSSRPTSRWSRSRAGCWSSGATSSSSRCRSCARCCTTRAQQRPRLHHRQASGTRAVAP